jgi:uncharacterized protein YprB with RNaseH-like and TPR domain
MLTNTFIHIQGIGLKTESDLWQAGIRSWEDVNGSACDIMPSGRGLLLRESISEAIDYLADQPEYFTDLLPSSQHWRIFPHFREKTAFIDIETTGLSDSCAITTIAVYDGIQIKYYVQGQNLDDFPNEINDYDVLVSYNGKSFDVPVINRYFDIKLRQAHIDLRYILHSLGIKGGLKGCEKQLGLDRGDLDGVDGYMAVLLWEHYQRTGEQQALETLLAYNIMDTVNLELLMVEAYNRSLALTPFYDELAITKPPKPPAIHFKPDRKLLLSLQAHQNNTWAGSY